MWTIGEVKRKGKWAFKKNYWKTVVVAFIMALLVGGGVGTYNFSNNNFNNKVDDNSPSSYSGYEYDGSFGSIEEEFTSGFEDGISAAMGGIAVASVLVFFSVFMIVFLIVLAIGIALDVLVINPIEVGSKSFFVKNLNKNAEVKEMLSSFDRGSYKNLIKVMFFKGLYTFLWSLLCLVPGIVKSYEYRMIPYIMAENPEMPMEQAFYESKRMMSGNKWHAFVLDLSFIGWYILSVFTLGILSIFYVNPYKYSTDAVLYETLRYGNGNVVYTEAPATVETN